MRRQEAHQPEDKDVSWNGRLLLQQHLETIGKAAGRESGGARRCSSPRSGSFLVWELSSLESGALGRGNAGQAPALPAAGWCRLPAGGPGNSSTIRNTLSSVFPPPTPGRRGPASHGPASQGHAGRFYLFLNI